MFTLPLYVILFLYLIYLAIFAIFSVINFYHIVTSGSFTIPSFAASFVVFTLTFLTLYFTWTLLAGVDWQQPITIFNHEWIPNVLAQ